MPIPAAIPESPQVVPSSLQDPTKSKSHLSAEHVQEQPAPLPAIPNTNLAPVTSSVPQEDVDDASLKALLKFMNDKEGIVSDIIGSSSAVEEKRKAIKMLFLPEIQGIIYRFSLSKSNITNLLSFAKNSIGKNLFTIKEDDLISAQKLREQESIQAAFENLDQYFTIPSSSTVPSSPQFLISKGKLAKIVKSLDPQEVVITTSNHRTLLGIIGKLRSVEDTLSQQPKTKELDLKLEEVRSYRNTLLSSAMTGCISRVKSAASVRQQEHSKEVGRNFLYSLAAAGDVASVDHILTSRRNQEQLCVDSGILTAPAISNIFRNLNKEENKKAAAISIISSVLPQASAESSNPFIRFLKRIFRPKPNVLFTTLCKDPSSLIDAVQDGGDLASRLLKLPNVLSVLHANKNLALAKFLDSPSQELSEFLINTLKFSETAIRSAIVAKATILAPLQFQSRFEKYLTQERLAELITSMPNIQARNDFLTRHQQFVCNCMKLNDPQPQDCRTDTGPSSASAAVPTGFSTLEPVVSNLLKSTGEYIAAVIGRSGQYFVLIQNENQPAEPGRWLCMEISTAQVLINNWQRYAYDYAEAKITKEKASGLLEKVPSLQPDKLQQVLVDLIECHTKLEALPIFFAQLPSQRTIIKRIKEALQAGTEKLQKHLEEESKKQVEALKQAPGATKLGEIEAKFRELQALQVQLKSLRQLDNSKLPICPAAALSLSRSPFEPGPIVQQQNDPNDPILALEKNIQERKIDLKLGSQLATFDQLCKEFHDRAEAILGILTQLHKYKNLQVAQDELSNLQAKLRMLTTGKTTLDELKRSIKSLLEQKSLSAPAPSSTIMQEIGAKHGEALAKFAGIEEQIGQQDKELRETINAFGLFQKDVSKAKKECAKVINEIFIAPEKGSSASVMERCASLQNSIADVEKLNHSAVVTECANLLIQLHDLRAKLQTEFFKMQEYRWRAPHPSVAPTKEAVLSNSPIESPKDSKKRLSFAYDDYNKELEGVIKELREATSTCAQVEGKLKSLLHKNPLLMDEVDKKVLSQKGSVAQISQRLGGGTMETVRNAANSVVKGVESAASSMSENLQKGQELTSAAGGNDYFFPM
ncbi:MAG: hypothetical protein WCW01_05005 [Gammaproteobacteria bacterium]